jgi:hypothetical protein
MLKPSTVRTCFVYDPDDGTIVHVHKEFTLEGATEPSESEVEETVRRLAEKPGRDLTQLKLLFAEDTRVRGTSYKVDLSTQGLSAVEG